MDALPSYKCKLCDKLPYLNEKHFQNHVLKKHPEATFESALSEAKRAREEDDDEALLLKERRALMVGRISAIQEAFKNNAVPAGVELFMEAFDELLGFVKNE